MQDAISNPRKSRGHPFAAGNRGGPGRPKGSRNRATQLLDQMAEGSAEAVLQGVLDQARAGDLRAAELVLARLWPSRRGRAVELDLPDTRAAEGVVAGMAAVVQAMASGRLTPEEAHAVGAVLELQRKAIETADLDRRLAALEAGQRQGTP